MRESTTYQAILQEGRAEGREEGMAKGRAEGVEIAVRETLLRLGMRRFGDAPQSILDALAAIHDVERLEELAVRLLEVENWDELLREEAAA